MPIYEYSCEKCATFEATQRIIEALSRCLACKGKVNSSSPIPILAQRDGFEYFAVTSCDLNGVMLQGVLGELGIR